MLKTIFTCTAYSIVIGDSLSFIMQSFGAHGIATSRQCLLLFVVLTILLPLCFRRDLGVLSYTSMVGVLGQLFVVSFMTVRFADGSYSPSGKFYNSIEERYRPNFDGGTNMWGVSVSSFLLLDTLSTAFIAHYNGPKFYSQLRDASPVRWNSTVSVGFLISLLIYLWIMTVGYLTFGKACQGNILDNYSGRDAGATAARMAILLAVMFGYPLAFTALRDSTISILRLSGQRRRVFCTVTLILIGCITTLGCLVQSLGFINSFIGGLCAAPITLIFPGVLHLSAAKLTHVAQVEKMLSSGAVGLGVVLTLAGTSISVLKA